MQKLGLWAGLEEDAAARSSQGRAQEQTWLGEEPNLNSQKLTNLWKLTVGQSRLDEKAMGGGMGGMGGGRSLSAERCIAGAFLAALLVKVFFYRGLANASCLHRSWFGERAYKASVEIAAERSNPTVVAMMKYYVLRQDLKQIQCFPHERVEWNWIGRLQESVETGHHDDEGKIFFAGDNE